MTPKFIVFESKENNSAVVEITEGKWKGLQFCYGVVSFEESPDSQYMSLKFDYNIVDGSAPTEDNELTEFEQALGDILTEIINRYSAHQEQIKEENENRADNSQQSSNE